MFKRKERHYKQFSSKFITPQRQAKLRTYAQSQPHCINASEKYKQWIQIVQRAYPDQKWSRVINALNGFYYHQLHRTPNAFVQINDNVYAIQTLAYDKRKQIYKLQQGDYHAVICDKHGELSCHHRPKCVKYVVFYVCINI